MRGMSVVDGRALEGEAHLAQSIADILTTPIGSRVLRRDYGSLLPELIDQPYSPTLRQKIMAAVAMALARWEPRIRLQRAFLSLAGEAGQFLLEIQGERTDVPPGSPLSAFSLSLTTGAASAPAA